MPGYAYGGWIASLIDCHSTGAAAAAMYRSEGRVKESKGCKVIVESTVSANGVVTAWGEVVAVQMPEIFGK